MVLPPSTIAARTVEGAGTPLRAAAEAGVLALGSHLGGGGSIEACMRLLDDSLAIVGEWVSYDDAARRLLDQWQDAGPAPPGYGHRLHGRDPWAVRLMQLSVELELNGGHTQFARAVEQTLSDRREGERAAALNADGAIAAVSGDLGLGAETATLLFTLHNFARPRFGRTCVRGAATSGGDAARRSGWSTITMVQVSVAYQAPHSSDHSRDEDSAYGSC